MDITPLKHTVQNLQKQKHDLYRQYFYTLIWNFAYF